MVLCNVYVCLCKIKNSADVLSSDQHYENIRPCPTILNAAVRFQRFNKIVRCRSEATHNHHKMLPHLSSLSVKENASSFIKWVFSRSPCNKPKPKEQPLFFSKHGPQDLIVIQFVHQMTAKGRSIGWSSEGGVAVVSW